MVGGMLSAYMAGLHFWWPKITGRMYPESMGRLAATILFIGFNLTFFPQFILGYLGMPRRYHAYSPAFQVLNILSTSGASNSSHRIFAASNIFSLVVEVREDRRSGSVAATGLEWKSQSPPLTNNFLEVPIVEEEAYDYDRIGEGVEVAG
jgi:cytochrome c oxidase subunit I